MVLTLYKNDASPPVRSVLMTIEALNIPDVEYVEVNFMKGDQFSEEYSKLNPQHTIPMLKDDDFVVWDSHAIAVYLLTVYGADDSLYPKDPKKRAIVDQRLHFDSGILFPAVRGTLVPVIIFGEKAFRPDNLDKIKAAYDFAEKFFTSPWMAGDEPTLADICCVSSISTLNEILPIDENLFPKLTGWLKNCSQLPYYKKANQPGLEELRGVIKTKLN